MPPDTPSLALGEQALKLNQFAEAERWFRQALTQDAQSTEARRGLAYALLQINHLAEALQLLEDVVQRAPADLKARLLFGRLCLRLQEPAAAEKHFQRILKKIPTSEAALSGLVDAVVAQNKSDEAQGLVKRILAFNPRSEVGHLVAANVAEMQADFEAAHRHYDQLVQLLPEQAQHRYHRSRSLLRRGELEQGWREYECRFAIGTIMLPPLQTPRWTGASVGHLLLVCEQGLGDTLQFARFISQVQAQAKVLAQRITLACPPALGALLTRSFGIETISLAASTFPEHDAHLPLMSLPHVLGLGSRTLAPVGRTLEPDAERRRLWAERLALKPERLNVGLVYASSIAHATEQFPHKKRSCTLADLAPLFDLANTEFFSLQMGVNDQLNHATPAPLHALATSITDFDDTAAIIDLLDVLVSVDTVTAHVAGALQKPLALLLPSAADWRWMQDATRTDWYATAHLFRQTRPGDWSVPVTQIRDFLARMVGTMQR